MPTPPSLAHPRRAIAALHLARLAESIPRVYTIANGMRVQVKLGAHLDLEQQTELAGRLKDARALVLCLTDCVKSVAEQERQRARGGQS